MKRNKALWISLAAGMLVAGTATAQEETALTLDQVVITATKFDKKSSETGKVVRVITREELERFRGRNLAEILNDQAGMVINNAYGAPGSNLSYHLRGAAPRYTTIQLDGIPVADPSGITTFFDLNSLSPDQIERIEILRGANSTLHGSGAVAGVINIITKKGGTKPISVNGLLSAGSYGTYRGNANLSGTLQEGLFDYNVGYTYLDAEGFSSAMKDPAADPSGEAFDKDGFHRHSLNVNLAVRPVTNLSIKPYVRYSGSEYGYDGGAFTDGPGLGENRFLQTGLGMVRYLDDRGQWVGSYAYSGFKREVDDDPGTGTALSFFDGGHHHAETYLNYRISSLFHFIAGADFNALESNATTPYGEISADSSHMNYGSFFGSVFLSTDWGFNLEVGGRFNRHSIYGSNGTYTFNPSYLISPKQKVFANMASAFRVPVLDELYASYGNPKLEPELSRSYEAGYEGLFAGDKVKAALTVFRRDIKDVITFGPEFRYINFDRQQDYGLEAEVEVLAGAMNLNAFYAFTDGELTTADTSYNNLYKRPRHSAGIRLGYQAGPDWYFSLNSRYMGERTDLVFTPAGNQEKTLDAFILFDLYAQYQLSRQVRFFADLKNLTDADYVESTGYTTRGFNFNAGLSLSF